MSSVALELEAAGSSSAHKIYFFVSAPDRTRVSLREQVIPSL